MNYTGVIMKRFIFMILLSEKKAFYIYIDFSDTNFV